MTDPAKLVAPIVKAIQAEQKVQNADIAKLETEARERADPEAIQAAGVREAATLATAGDRDAATLATAGVRDAATLQAASVREEASRTKVGQRRVNLLWETTQAVLAVSVPLTALGSCIYILMLGPNDLKNAAFVMLGGAMNLVLGVYFQRTNHTRTGGVQSEHRGE